MTSTREPLNGKTILLIAEQGLGDTIQFCRYVQVLEAQGARVLLEVPDALVGLLSSLSVQVNVHVAGQSAQKADYALPLMSLPFACKTSLQSIPANVPYLHPEAEKVQKWLQSLGGKENKMKVGLVWSGGYRRDQPETWAVNERRNIPLGAIAKLNCPQVQFVSLQKGDPAETEMQLQRGQVWPSDNLLLPADQLQDFSDTAALIQNLDLIISVDTSVAHLAGALGKPVWLLNRYDTCWRWMLEREDSPWYPTMKIYRQPVRGDWETVLERVREDLIALTQERS